MNVVPDSDYQSTLDAVYVYVVPWSEFLIVLSHPDYPQGGGSSESVGSFNVMGNPDTDPTRKSGHVPHIGPTESLTGVPRS